MTNADVIYHVNSVDKLSVLVITHFDLTIWLIDNVTNIKEIQCVYDWDKFIYLQDKYRHFHYYFLWLMFDPVLVHNTIIHYFKKYTCI